MPVLFTAVLVVLVTMLKLRKERHDKRPYASGRSGFMMGRRAECEDSISFRVEAMDGHRQSRALGTSSVLTYVMNLTVPKA